MKFIILILNFVLIIFFCVLCKDHERTTTAQLETRVTNLDNKLTYWDIWETQANSLTEQYYTYYIYIWEHWHEMEERLLWIACIRAMFVGI